MTKKAERELREAIRLNPSFADSYYQLSKLFLQQNPKLAEENLLTCLRLNPEHASAKYELGHLYLRTGRQRDGQKLIEQFISQQETEKLKEQQRPRLESTQ
jgi:tetratricopeptide (TPR) repeat protein